MTSSSPLTHLVRGPIAALLALACGVSVAQVPTPTEVSEQMPLAGQSLLLDISNSSSMGVMVGERGHVLVSTSRRDWSQVANVPTRATLTAVGGFQDLLWAVGHDGTIIHSKDAGMSWTLQRVDLLEDADNDPPQKGVPLLDVLFLSSTRGFAIGAYGVFLETTDAGATWMQRNIGTGAGEDEFGDDGDDSAIDDEFDDDEYLADDEMTFDSADAHLNAIARLADGTLVIAAERGVMLRSTDDAQTWTTDRLDYDGSMFGLITLDNQEFVAFGMRGNAFSSKDGGESWQRLDTGVDLSLMGGAPLPNGGFVLVGGNGVVLVRSSADQAIRSYTAVEGVTLSGVLPMSGSDFILIGESGWLEYQPR